MSKKPLDVLNGFGDLKYLEMLLREGSEDGPHSVMFRMYRRDTRTSGEIEVPEAFFPYGWAGNNERGHRTINCYEHQGQHGAASPNAIVANNRPATPAEYAELAAEITSRNYNLVVINRFSWQKMLDACAAQEAWFNFNFSAKDGERYTVEQIIERVKNAREKARTGR